MKSLVTVTGGVLLSLAFLGCSEPLTTREAGAVIVTVGGAAAAGIVGGAVGRPGAGAAVGGALGLGTGALIGDRLQAVEKRQTELEKQIRENELELQRQRQELEKLKSESKER